MKEGNLDQLIKTFLVVNLETLKTFKVQSPCKSHRETEIVPGVVLKRDPLMSKI